jgi:FkbM family methyltransferase
MSLSCGHEKRTPMIRAIGQAIKRHLPETGFSHSWVTLDSGVKVCIDSRSTLEIFAELFVSQPYGPALEFREPPRLVVDLGAHRGLFMLYVLHQLRKRKCEDPRFVCIEAASDNFRALERHIRGNDLATSVHAVLGAVCGRRSGTVELYYAPNAHGMATLVRKGRLTTQRVPVVDLSKEVAGRRIDLLKIDIEGSEQDFFEEYEDVLAKTQVLVAEFHLKQVVYARCRLKLEKAGLEYSRRCFEVEDKLVVEVFRRPI